MIASLVAAISFSAFVIGFNVLALTAAAALVLVSLPTALAVLVLLAAALVLITALVAGIPLPRLAPTLTLILLVLILSHDRSPSFDYEPPVRGRTLGSATSSPCPTTTDTQVGRFGHQELAAAALLLERFVIVGMFLRRQTAPDLWQPSS
jgi:hypothetical protein